MATCYHVIDPGEDYKEGYLVAAREDGTLDQCLAVGISPQGHDGISGMVDNRFFEKYGMAFVLAGISSAVRLSTAAIPSEKFNDDDRSDLACRMVDHL